MFLAAAADSKAAASWEKGRKAAQIQPESAFGWVLVGSVLGRLVSFHGFDRGVVGLACNTLFTTCGC